MEACSRGSRAAAQPLMVTPLPGIMQQVQGPVGRPTFPASPSPSSGPSHYLLTSTERFWACTPDVGMHFIHIQLCSYILYAKICTK